MCRLALAAAAAVLLPSLSCAASPAGWGLFGELPPGAQCRAAIDRAERAYGLPAHLLAAIGRVESGRATPDGRVDPWPYSIDVEGSDRVFDSKAAAVAGVRAEWAAGARSIDVGCLQVNLMYHPDAFASLEEAFDPWHNADYAARFLVQLHAQTGSWAAATASYHSATPQLGTPYAAKVGAALAEEAGMAAAAPFAAGLRGAPTPSAGMMPSGITFGAVGRPASGTVLRAGTAPAAGQGGRLAPLMPAANGGGRGLDAYRSTPVRLAATLLRR